MTGVTSQRLFPLFLFSQLNSSSIIVHPQIFLILPCKGSFLPCRRQGDPYGLAEKNHPHFVPVFFPPSLALDKAKNWRGHVRNRNTALQGAGHVIFNTSRFMKRYKSWKEISEYGLKSGCAYSGRKEQTQRSNQTAVGNPVINLIIL